MELKMMSLLILVAGFWFVHGHSLGCDDVLKDVVIILDSSDSISEKDFSYAKYAIFKTIRSLKLGKDQSRVAFIQFGSDAQLKFNLDTYKDMKSISLEIKNTKHTHGLTAIGKALKLTVEKVMPKMRINVKKMAIIFTDGVNNVYPPPQIYADTLKSNFVRIISVGIGSEISRTELARISSDNSVFFMSTFKELLQDIKKVSDNLCIEPDPIPLKPCTISQQDLVFVIDSSNSLSQEEFAQSKSFVKTFIKNANLGSDKTRVAMITFSQSIRLDFNIDTYTSRNDYIMAIDRAEKFGTATGIGVALNAVLTQVLPKRRSTVPFNIVLVTDGANNMYPNPSIPAKELKSKGAHIISVGVGKDIDFNELRAISSDNQIITVLNYSHLLGNVKSVQRMVICG